MCVICCKVSFGITTIIAVYICNDWYKDRCVLWFTIKVRKWSILYSNDIVFLTTNTLLQMFKLSFVKGTYSEDYFVFSTIEKLVVYEYKLNSQIRSRQILLLENNQYCKNDNMEISFYILVVDKHCRKFIYVHIVMNIYLHDQWINTRIFMSLLVNIAAVRLGKYVWVKCTTKIHYR